MHDARGLPPGHESFLDHRIIRTSDVDDQSALLRDWNQTYDQMSSGRFVGLFREARLDGFHLFREVTSAALYQNGGLRDDLFAIGVPIALKGAATFCGQTCDGSKLHLFSGQNGFEFSSPSGLDIVGVVLPRKPFLAGLQEEEQRQIAQAFKVSRLISAPREKIRHLREIIVQLFELFDRSDCLFDVAETLAAVQRDLYEVMADAALPQNTQEALSNSRKPCLVRKVRELATAERLEGPVTIEELCRDLGVSRRTLQYCFNEVMGMAPAAYLRIVRLNGARRSLKAGACVTEAATTWGFWHFGRFAQAYRSLFGEQPSVTQRQAVSSNHRHNRFQRNHDN